MSPTEITPRGVPAAVVAVKPRAALNSWTCQHWCLFWPGDRPGRWWAECSHAHSSEVQEVLSDLCTGSSHISISNNLWTIKWNCSMWTKLGLDPKHWISFFCLFTTRSPSPALISAVFKCFQSSFKWKGFERGLQKETQVISGPRTPF